jgi:hypothetical protein
MRRVLFCLGLVLGVLCGIAHADAATVQSQHTSMPRAEYKFLQIAQFGSYGNDRVADCSLSAAADIVQFWRGAQQPLRSRSLLIQYAALSPTNDGVSSAATFSLWENQGILGNKISGVTPIKRNILTVKRAIEQDAVLYAVVNLPTSNGPISMVLEAVVSSETPSESPDYPWTVGNTGSGPLLEHAVAVAGYGPHYVYLVTWGAVQPVTWAWFLKYDVSIYAVRR